jgi:hypothetical protein
MANPKTDWIQAPRAAFCSSWFGLLLMAVDCLVPGMGRPRKKPAIGETYKTNDRPRPRGFGSLQAFSPPTLIDGSIGSILGAVLDAPDDQGDRRRYGKKKNRSLANHPMTGQSREGALGTGQIVGARLGQVR